MKELQKIPSLVQHYFHHTSEHEANLSFIAFLNMHYGDSKHAGEEDHGDLPLYHSLCNCLLFIHEEYKPLAEPQHTGNHTLCSAYSNQYSCILQQGVFQPPKS